MRYACHVLRGGSARPSSSCRVGHSDRLTRATLPNTVALTCFRRPSMPIGLHHEPREYQTPSFYKPVLSADAADWYVQRLSRDAWTLSLFVPSGYDAYVRIPHPKWQPVPEGTTDAIRYHNQWTRPIPTTIIDTRAYVPDEGQLIGPWADSVFHALANATPVANPHCICALWDGYGTERPPTARFETGMGLGFLLYTTRLDVIAQWLSTHRIPSPSNIPVMTWPEGREWCLVTPFQFFSTYIAGTNQLIARILDLRSKLDVRTASLGEDLR